MSSPERPHKRQRLSQRLQQQTHNVRPLAPKPNEYTLAIPQSLAMPVLAGQGFKADAPEPPGSPVSNNVTIAPKRCLLLHPCRTIGGFPWEVAGLTLPDNITPEEAFCRHEEMEREIAYQRGHPPALPPSMVDELPVKPQSRPWSEFPDDVSPERRKEIEQENNAIAAENQKVERERNNKAAKKSRLKRVESLDNTRKMLNKKTAECAWWRMRAMASGATADEWGRVSDAIKASMIQEIDDEVEVVHKGYERLKKKEEAQKRTERNKARAAQKAAARAASEASR